MFQHVSQPLPPPPTRMKNCCPCGQDVYNFGMQQRHVRLSISSSFLQYVLKQRDRFHKDCMIDFIYVFIFTFMSPSAYRLVQKFCRFPVFLQFEFFSFPGGSKIKTVKKKAKETAHISELYIRMRITKYFMFRFTLFR